MAAQMVLLINPDLPPSSPWGLSKTLPPLGLMYIGAVLERDGFHVKILDNYMLNKPVNKVKDFVSDLDPEIVGISCNSVNYEQAVKIAKAVKEASPKSVVVMGGPHATCMPETLLAHKEVDFVIAGEGEFSMLELAKNVSTQKLSRLQQIPGLAYRVNNHVAINPQSFIEDLDWVPMPARHLIDLQRYDRNVEYVPAKPVDILNVTRGCPFKCRFCETKKIWGTKHRVFSPRRVVEEIEHLIDNYGAEGVYFIGDNFTLDGEWVKKICSLIIKRKLDIKWACDTRVDLISRDLIRCMRAAGCRTIWFGVESGSPRILNKLNKGITLKQAMDAVKLCRKEGISTACSFLLGVPGETIKDMEATLSFALKLNPDWCQFNIYIACPGSSLYEEVIQSGMYDRWSDFIYFVKTDEFNYASLLEIQKKFHKTFHRSPKRLLRRICERAKAILS
ncbi:MAG: radical SAM protein [Candidatus Bathyarchaeia archaeon]